MARKTIFTDEERAKIVSLYHELGSAHKVAKRMGYGSQPIYRTLHEEGVSLGIRRKNLFVQKEQTWFPPDDQSIAPWVAGILDTRMTIKRRDYNSIALVVNLPHGLGSVVAKETGAGIFWNFDTGSRFVVGSRRNLMAFLEWVIPHMKHRRSLAESTLVDLRG